MSGLYGKYDVRNVETGAPVAGFCFVLKPGTDRHARAAMLAYADSCESDDPELAREIRVKVRESVREWLPTDAEIKAALEVAQRNRPVLYRKMRMLGLKLKSVWIEYEPYSGRIVYTVRRYMFDQGDTLTIRIPVTTEMLTEQQFPNLLEFLIQTLREAFKNPPPQNPDSTL